MTDSMSARSRVLYCALGTAVLVAAAGTAVIASTRSHAGSTYYTAEFGRAGQGLDARSDVKVRGITVGNVESVRLGPDGRVTVRLRVEKGVQVPATAEARIDPVSLFGPKEIDLDLGSGAVSGPYLADGARIARTQDPSDPAETARPAYELASRIDPQDVATLMHTFSAGLSGQGPALRRTLDNGALVIDRAHANRETVRRLVSDLAGLGGTLGDSGEPIVAAARDASELGPLLTERPDKIGQLLDQAGRLSTQVGDDLDAYGGAFGGLVDGAGRAARVAAPQSRNIIVLMDVLNGFFGGLANVMTGPGPNGYRPAVLRGQAPLNVCQIIVDVCPPGQGG
ncbi:MlaD family protein [Spirillospora sp. NPDC047279]|uniref:MlaD family protein n=1 Tax=Spirillospora sp. NPDC047279 TaxID=3155478 RepID=UPI0033D8F907